MTIPFLPPLTLSLLAGRQRKHQEGFSVFSPEYILYYRARSGIWNGMDVLGLRPGDQVLMPAYHHGVEVDTLKSKGLAIRYYGVDKQLRPDIGRLKGLLCSRTRLLYVIHYFGMPQPVDDLLAFARQHGLFLFEDCALSLFSRLPSGIPLGSFGDVSVFCLYKYLPVPHGGVMVLNGDFRRPAQPVEPALLPTLGYTTYRYLDHLKLDWGAFGGWISRVARGLGKAAKKTGRYDALVIESNRFDVNVAGKGVAPLTRRILDRIDTEDVMRRRRTNYARLEAMLDEVVRVPFPELKDGVCPLLFPIEVNDKRATRQMLLKEGIETVDYWSWDNSDIPAGTFPDVDFLRRHLLAVPIHQGLAPRHIDRIAAALNRHAK